MTPVTRGHEGTRGSKSAKTPVIERLFFFRFQKDGTTTPRYDKESGDIPESLRLVYMYEVELAAAELGVTLGNKYAFMKDLLRYSSRGANWPEALRDLGWGGVQVTGRDENGLRCFRFVPYSDGQREPFPDDCPLDADAAIIPIQSVTMSIASKQVERLDEPRLMQIAVELRVIESHFSMKSPLSKDLLHVDHIQMGMKLGGAEIDALFQAELGHVESRERRLALITVEAKQAHENVTFAQILAQVQSASRLGIDYDMIVPLVVKHRLGGIHVVEFAALERRTTEYGGLSAADLRRTCEAFYVVHPPVKGLGAIESVRQQSLW